jgi:hypothetical protein
MRMKGAHKADDYLVLLYFIAKVFIAVNFDRTDP